MAPDQQASSDSQATDAVDAHPTPSSPLTHRPRTKEDFQKILLESHIHHDLLHTAAILETQQNREDEYKFRNQQAEDYKKLARAYRVFGQTKPPAIAQLELDIKTTHIHILVPNLFY